MKKIIDSPEPLWIPKGWGGEKWIDNREEYCCKILFFIKDKKLSVHYHKLKTETFYCLEGKVLVRWNDDVKLVETAFKEMLEPSNVLESKVLVPGDTFYVPPGRVHQIVGLEDAKLIEASTQHFDSDSYRIKKGD